MYRLFVATRAVLIDTLFSSIVSKCASKIVFKPIINEKQCTSSFLTIRFTEGAL